MNVSCQSKEIKEGAFPILVRFS